MRGIWRQWNTTLTLWLLALMYTWFQNTIILHDTIRNNILYYSILKCSNIIFNNRNSCSDNFFFIEKLSGLHNSYIMFTCPVAISGRPGWIWRATTWVNCTFKYWMYSNCTPEWDSKSELSFQSMVRNAINGVTCNYCSVVVNPSALVCNNEPIPMEMFKLGPVSIHEEPDGSSQIFTANC